MGASADSANVTEGCLSGYTGALCATCTMGTTRGPGRTCQACPDPGSTALIMAVVFLGASLALIYLIYDGVSGAIDIEKTGVLPFHTLALRTLISYLQVASMIRLYDMTLPDAVDGLITVETVASSAGDAMVRIDCAMRVSALDLFMAKQAIVYLSPLLLMSMLAVFHVIRIMMHKVVSDTGRDHFVAGSMVILNLLFPTLVKRSALMFSCREIGDGVFLDEALDIRCFESDHVRAFMMTTVPGIIVYVIGFPVGLLYMLMRLKRRGALRHDGPNYDRRWVLRLGFLFAGYEEDFVFWESIVLARKALLSGAAVFLAYRGTTVQVVVAILILFVCFAAQMKYQPLEHDWHDLMEERSLMASTLILIFCLLANVDSSESLDAVRACCLP